MQIREYHKPIRFLSDQNITVRIMTPDGYEDRQKDYPVVYINDGQDVFSDSDILWGECSMDYVNYYKAYHRFLPDILIVALVCPKNRDDRTALYSPFVSREENGTRIYGQGKEYLRWIVQELKPWVDETYRTKPQPEYTALMGYSTGGLFALYGALSRPDIFTRFAAMSSAVYIWMDELKKFLENASYRHLRRVYMDVGTNEYGRITTKQEFVAGVDLVYRTCLAHGVPADYMKYDIYPGAVHSQTEWKKRFPDALRWIFIDC